jgi:hypothetical protein
MEVMKMKTIFANGTFGDGVDWTLETTIITKNKGYNDEYQEYMVTVEQTEGVKPSAAICLFNETYRKLTKKQLKADLKAQHLEMIAKEI